MGLSASQGRLLLLTAKQSDLEFRAQQISQKRLVLAQQLEEISKDYEDATSNRVMSIAMYQEGTDEDGKKVQTNGNLTYKNLISGTLADPNKAKLAGLNTGVYDITASSNKAYRLVDTSGAIVVSNENEIPTSADETTYKSATKNSSGIYSVKTTDNTKNSSQEVESLYYIPKGQLATDFENYRKDRNSGNTDDTSITLKCSYDSVNGLIQMTYGGETKTYKLDGTQVTGDDASKFSETGDITLAANENAIPNSSTTNTRENVYTKVKGNDGVITLYNGSVAVNRYVVDEGLKTGSNSNSADPNYLQDCIRNGKYLIQQYHKNDDNTGTVSWDLVSWDATSNISDRYYDEDDATAKAIYDRKQNEIQNADKKLELELDNVESQRNAVKTEIESVEKVINDNIDKSFKTFA